MQLSHINNVLHVEDEVFIALDIETTLLDAGVKRVSHVATRSDAFIAIETSRPDVVILDIEVLDGSTAELAELLRSRSIPFIVHSGSASGGVDRSHFDTVFLAKPSTHADLLAALSAATAK